jgi:nitric oxide reductase subunit B
VGVWNFIGAGVFGFLINTPIVSYFEMGTTLTPNHGHAAMFGVFGMLGLGGLVFCTRAMQSDAAWRTTEKFVRLGYGGLNASLALMVLVDLFPAGVLQLWRCRLQRLLARAARRVLDEAACSTRWSVRGDTVFIVLGALPITIGALRPVLTRETAG